MNVDFGFLRLARRASMESTCDTKVGAVISNRRPLTFGWNKSKSHPIYSNPSETLRDTIHAEMDCLRFLSFRDMEGATVWVYRENGFGMPALARPCEECLVRLQEYGVRKLVYTIDELPYYRIERLR